MLNHKAKALRRGWYYTGESTPEERAIVRFIGELVNANYKDLADWKTDEQVFHEAERELNDSSY